MEYQLDFSWLGTYAEAIGDGVVATIGLIVATSVLALPLSVAGAACRRSPRAWVRAPAAAYVELIRNTPFVVQLFFVFFGLPSAGIRIGAFTAAVMAMTINLTAYAIEILRAGLDSVTVGQREAGAALGLRPAVVFLTIVLPQALRAVFPALASQIVITMLESAVVSQIAVRDLTYEADLMQSRTFRAFETYLLITAIYLGMSILLRRLLALGGRRLLGAGAA